MEIKGNINGIEFGSIDQALEILGELCGIKQAPETKKSSEDSFILKSFFKVEDSSSQFFK